LQACLGYELYQDFIDGLSQPVIDQKWLDIRDGVVFDSQGLWPPFYWRVPYLNYYRNWFIPQNPRRRMEWIGFTNSLTFGTNPQQSGERTLTTDAGGENPVSGLNAVTIPSLAGSKYWIERKGLGYMEPGVDVSITNNSQTITLLKPGDVFNTQEKFILHFSQVVISGNVSPIYTSPIAAIVYYEYARDDVSHYVGVGVVDMKSENSEDVSAARKMVDAFNQASKDIFTLWTFLDLKGIDVYPSYDRLKIDYNYFKPINVHNI